MFVYWGAYAMGKLEVMLHSLINGCSAGQLQGDKIINIHTITKTVTGDDWYISTEEDVYTKVNNKFVRTPRVNEFFPDKIRYIGLWEDHRQIDKGPLPPLTFKSGGKSQELPESSPHPYEFPCNLKDTNIHECYLIRNMHPLINYRHVMKQVLSYPHKHIMPYRKYTDPRPLVHRLHQYNKVKHFGGKYSTVFDMYEKNKEDCWKYISKFDTDNRNLEAILIDSGVKYEYFNLDTDSYCDVFNWSIGFDKHLTEPKYNLSDPDVLKRYNKALDICSEYLKVTGIRDNRLFNRSKDGI